MESDDGDVQLSVNHQGRLVSLSLAPGCTTRYTNEGLERVISTTLQAAVADAYAERDEIEKNAEEAALTAAQLLGELRMRDQPCSLPAANRPVAVATCRGSALR